MKRAERIDDETLAAINLLDGQQAQIWTALPGIITKVNLTQQTCEVQPSIQAQLTDAAGATSWVSLPVLVDCPIVFPGGGGFTLSFPVAAGDEVLVVFASRCIDAWWQSGGVQQQSDLRMHDLSDGFVIPGIKSVPLVPGSLSASNVELRSVDGAATIRIKPNHDIEFQTSGNLNISAASVNITGDLTNNGKVVGSTHTHSGVQPGGGTTGVPV